MTTHTTPIVPRSRAASRARAGMTLIEVIIAVVILSGAMLGLSAFGSRFQHLTSEASVQTLASDLATQRLEEIKAHRVYSTLVSTFNSTTQTYPTHPVYKGFTRTTAAVRCSGCPTTTNDYVTVTVTVTGNQLPTPMKKTTIIAAF